MFHRCLREYYLHYYASWGGWSASADPSSVRAYALRRLTSIESCVDELLRDTLRVLLLESRKSNGHPVREGLRRAKGILNGRFRGFRGRSNDDINKELDFVERFYGGMNWNDLFSVLSSLLDAVFENLANGDIPGSLFDLPYLAFIQYKPPGSFIRCGVKVWTAPDFIWRDGSDVRVLNLFTRDPTLWGNWSMKAAVDAMFAETLCRVSNAVVSSAFLHDVGFPVLEYRSAENELDSLIKDDIDAMLALTNLDTDISESAFPPCGDSDSCSLCRFQALCRDILHAF